MYFKAKKLTRIDIIAAIFLLAGLLVYLFTPNDISSIKSGRDAVQNPWVALMNDDGRIYIADQDRGRIMIIDSDGKILKRINQFSYIDNMTIDDNGKIYVIDTSWKADSFMVAGDTLYMFDPSDDSVTELYHEDYKNAAKHQMFGVKIIGGEVNFVCANEKEVIHIVLSTDGTEKRRKIFSYDDAVNTLQDICVNNNGNKLYAIDKRGEIICFDETADRIFALCRWDKIGDDEFVELYRMAVADNDVIYATEIVNNNIIKFDNGKISVFYSGGPGTFNISVAKYIGLISEGSFLILDHDGKVIRNADNIEYPSDIKILAVVNALSLIIFLLAAFYFILRLTFVVLLVHITVTQLVSRSVLVAVSIVVSIIAYQLLFSFYNLLINSKLDKLEIVAYNISRMITADDINGIKKPSDFMNPSFMNISRAMKSTIDYSYDDSFYANVVRYDRDKNMAYDIAFLDNSIGAYYPLLGSEADEVISVYDSGKNLRSSTVTENGGFTYVKVPVFDNNKQVAGLVEVGTWTSAITNQVISIIWNTTLQLAVWLIMIFFILNEIFEFMNLRELEAGIKPAAGEMSLSMNRLLIFLVLFTYNLPSVFLPVYVANIYLRTADSVNGLAMSAPISINMALLGIAGLFGYRIAKKFTFVRAMTFGAVLAMMGDLMLVAAQGYLYILAGLILNGIGVGVQMNLVHAVNTKLAEDKKDNTIIASYQAGSLSGVIIGMMAGAILADMFGQRSVFVGTATLWFLIALSVLFGVKNVSLESKPVNETKEIKKISPLQFLLSFRVFSFLILITFFSAMISSFVYYYVPVYSDHLGYGSNATCLLIIIFALCGIYLSGFATKFMTEKFGKYSMYVSCVISISSLLTFAFYQNINMLVISLLALGFASCFGPAVRLMIFSDLRETREYGAEAATGIYDLVELAGGAVGPMIFASMFAGNFLTGMIIFTGILLAASAIYFVIAHSAKESGAMKVNHA